MCLRAKSSNSSDIAQYTPGMLVPSKYWLFSMCDLMWCLGGCNMVMYAQYTASRVGSLETFIINIQYIYVGYLVCVTCAFVVMYAQYTASRVGPSVMDRRDLQAHSLTNWVTAGWRPKRQTLIQTRHAVIYRDYDYHKVDSFISQHKQIASVWTTPETRGIVILKPYWWWGWPHQSETCKLMW